MAMTSTPVGKKVFRMDVVCKCGGDAKLVGMVDGGKEIRGYKCDKCFTFYTKREAKTLNLERKYVTR